jgi:hypothetical protein
MPSITLKNIPPDLHAQIRQASGASHRSMQGEILARVERTFDGGDGFTTAEAQALIDEADASGPDQKFTRRGLRRMFDDVKATTRKRMQKLKGAP